MFKGSIVAIVTPFKNGQFDEKSFEELIEWHISEGTNAIVPCGTTGESATLDYEEHMKVIEAAIKCVNKTIPVIAGTGANSTEETIMLTKKAQELKADAALLVAPYYNKPTQEGLFRHYDAVAKAVDIPLVLYNVPSRTVVNIAPATVERIVEKNKNVVAIKEASANMAQVSDIIARCGDRLTVLSGDDFTTFTLLALGGKGVISVAANVVPGAMSRLCSAFEDNNIKESLRLHYHLFDLFGALFLETNPIPVKTALAMMGKISEEFRLPLCHMASGTKDALKKCLIDYKLISS